MYTLKYLIFGPVSIKVFLVLVVVALFVLLVFFFQDKSKIDVYNSYANEFEKTFWSGIVLEDFFEQNKKSFYHPIASIFVFAMNEWNAAKVSSIASSESHIVLERIKMSIEIAKERIKEMMTQYSYIFSFFSFIFPLFSLASIIFLISGLFFDIGENGQFSIDKIATMIGGSILIAGFGLFCSAVAFIMMYVMNNKIDKFLIRTDTFGFDLYSTLSKELQTKISSYEKEPQEDAEDEENDEEEDEDGSDEEESSEDEDDVKDVSPKDGKKSDLDDDI